MVDPKGEAALERAFEQENLLPVYQPIHEAKSGRVIAAEALLRQRRESGELREACIITETAEEGSSNTLFALDSLVMRMVYEDAATWQSHAARNVRLNVNLSPREFQEGNVIDRLTNLITRCGIDTSRINLEITETSYIDEPEQTMDVLRQLKKMGISLWLDDFGTDHSSLEHVQLFPVDGIKIPAKFVKDLQADRRCRAIVRALLSLAHEVKIEVIAEGVEHEEQRQFLLDHGCEYIQGFLFSKPMEREEFEAFVTAQGG